MRVVIAGGGTGGHFYPALAVSNLLRRQGIEVFYVGSKFGIEFKKRTSLSEFSPEFFKVRGIRRKGIAAVSNAWLLLSSVFGAVNYLKKLNPDKVVVFGGYTSFPLGVAAFILRIPLIVHEQNSIPGKTNLFLSKFARKVLLGMENARGYFRNVTTVFTGNPLREEVVKGSLEVERLRIRVLERLGFSHNLRTLLVLGGSQGALSINRLMKRVVASLAEKGDNFQIVHLCGEGKEEDLEKFYREKGIVAKVFPYYDRIWELYAVADVAISRAGAVAVSELSLYGIPTVFIPYPYAVDNHQFFNVSVIAESGGCYVCEERSVTPEKISSLLHYLFSDIITAQEMSEKFKGFSIPDATERVVKEIVNG